MKINDVLVEGPVLQAKKPAQQPDEMGRVEPTMDPQAQQPAPAAPAKPAQKPAQTAPAPAQPATSNTPPDPGAPEEEKPSPDATREYNPRAGTWGWRSSTGWVGDEQDIQQEPAQAAPAAPAPAQEPAQTAPAKPAQQKVTVGQINKTIPSLRTRDLQSVKKTVDTTIAKKTGQQTQTQAPAQQAQDPAQQTQGAQQAQPAQQYAPQQGGDPYEKSRVDLSGYEVNQHGKLVKKNPGFFGTLKNAAKAMVQGAGGGKVDPNAPWFQGYKGQDWNEPTYQDKVNRERAAIVGNQPAGTIPQSASAIAQGMRTAKPKQTQQTQQQAPSNLAQGVQVVNQEPIVLRYQGKDFGLNDQGQWVSQKTGKAPAQAMQQFLSQQHDASLNV